MIEWIEVVGSSMIKAEAFVEEEEAIYLRFMDGACWRYFACSRVIWEEFTAPGQSRGKYFHKVLKYKPGERFDG